MKSKITKSSGSVFVDLGFAPEEVAVLTLRAELMVALRKLIADKGWDPGTGRWRTRRDAVTCIGPGAR